MSLVDASALTEAVANLLGLHPVEIGWRFARGESLAEMAADQGVPRAALERGITHQLMLDYDRAVAASDMTPAYRELLRETTPMMDARLAELHAGEPWIVVSDAS